MKSLCSCIVLSYLILSLNCTQNSWIPLFDGKTMTGWQASENKDSWKVEDGALVTRGARSHLYYMGDANNHNFKNFEFSADVKTEPGSNSGIYIHTEYLESGWPAKGYECQIINSAPKVQPGQYVERKMTGSLYAVRNVWKAPVKDNEWFNYHIVVQGKTIQIYINDELTADYTEQENPYRPESIKGRLLSSGTFALQCHDPGSVVYFKNLKVKPLPENLSTPGKPLDDQEFEKKLIDLSNRNFPVVDLHVHLKAGLTRDAALANARMYGYTYGVAVNCGLKMGIETEDSLKTFLASYKRNPLAYFAMQAEGREWVKLFSKETIAQFDYRFTDGMTWTNDKGKRMRLWMKNETEVGNPQNFIEQLVDRIEKILKNEPINIYVNPTFLPEPIKDKYDELWTPKRMDKVIKALVANKIALEINNRYKIPSSAFIKRAKAGGVKFTFGTNNTGANDLGRMDYAIAMIEECALTPEDMWLPER